VEIERVRLSGRWQAWSLDLPLCPLVYGRLEALANTAPIGSSDLWRPFCRVVEPIFVPKESTSLPKTNGFPASEFRRWRVYKYQWDKSEKPDGSVMSTVVPSSLSARYQSKKEKWKMCIFIFLIWPRQTHTKTRRGAQKKSVTITLEKKQFFEGEIWERKTRTSDWGYVNIRRVLVTFRSPAELGGKWRSVPSGMRSNPKVSTSLVNLCLWIDAQSRGKTWDYQMHQMTH